MPESFDPPPEDQRIVLIDESELRRAERLISSCEECNPGQAEVPFDTILDFVTNSNPAVTNYILEKPGRCPNCKRDILEKTLVEPA